MTNPSGMLGEHEKSCQLQLIYKLFAFYCLKTKAVCQWDKKNTNSDLVYLVADSRKTNEKG